MKPFQDKITLLWKWGLYGEYKYQTEEDCRRSEMKLLIERLRAIKEECQNLKIQTSSLEHTVIK